MSKEPRTARVIHAEIMQAIANIKAFFVFGKTGPLEDTFDEFFKGKDKG